MSERTARCGAIVLAAGQGKRMRSRVPKVLHEVADRPILDHVCHAIRPLVDELCVVIGGELESFDAFRERWPGAAFVEQQERRGTGDAAASGLAAWTAVAQPPFARSRHLAGPSLSADYALICTGDTPALESVTLASFIDAVRAAKAPLAVLGMRPPDPTGYGRLVTDDGQILAQIVEDADADEEQRRVGLCNTGIIMAEVATLASLLSQLTDDNEQGEYYLTDCVRVARENGLGVLLHTAPDAAYFAGVNDQLQRAGAEHVLLQRYRRRLMQRGVHLQMPGSIFIGAETDVQAQARIDAHVSLLGSTTVESGAWVKAGCHLEDVKIGRGAVVGAHSLLRGGEVREGEAVPPGSVRIG